MIFRKILRIEREYVSITLIIVVEFEEHISREVLVNTVSICFLENCWQRQGQGKKRRFIPSWFNLYEPWLEYCVKKDDAFDENDDTYFVVKGFSN